MFTTSKNRAVKIHEGKRFLFFLLSYLFLSFGLLLPNNFFGETNPEKKKPKDKDLAKKQYRSIRVRFTNKNC